MQLLLLTTAGAAAACARGALGPLQEAIQEALSLSDNEMSLVQGAALALPFAIAAVSLGLLIDRMSRVRLLLIFAVVTLIGSVTSALASGFATLFLSRCVVGLASIAINPTALSILADLYVPERRGRATMAVAVGQYVGTAAAFLLGGVLLARLGARPQGWRWSLFALTGILAPLVLLILAMREPTRSSVNETGGSMRGALRMLWSCRAALIPNLVGVVFIEIAIGAVFVWTAPALSRGLHVTPVSAAQTVAVGVILSGVLGPLIGGVLADYSQRLGGPRRTLFLLSGLASLAAPSGMFAIASSGVWAGALFATFVTTASAIVVMSTTLLSIVVPNELRGLCTSILVAVSVVFGVGLSPLMVSLVSGAIGGPALLGRALAVVGVGSSVLAAGAFRVGGHHFARVSVQV